MGTPSLYEIQKEARPGHHGEVLNALSGDYARYQYCRAMAEKYRNKWWDGKLDEVRKAREEARRDDRLRRRSAEEIDQIGEQRWSRSVESKDLIGLEQMWHRWMTGYAQIMTMESLNGLLRRLRS